MIRIKAKMPKVPARGKDAGWIDQVHAAIRDAKAEVKDDEFYFICRYRGYFRPGAHGYTDRIARAGLFSAEKARSYLDVEGVSLIPLSSATDELERLLEEAREDVATLSTLLANPDRLTPAPPPLKG